MHPQDFDLLYQLEEKFWWFVAMRQIMDTIAAKDLNENIRVLDAGCGTGFNLGHYGATGRRDVYGLDIADAALKHVRKRGFTKIVQASITDIPFQTSTFDLMFSFDVVSMTFPATHVASVHEMYRVLKPGGHVLFRVAAFKWLWSSHDEQLEVRYRFTRSEFISLLSKAGFIIEWSSYANAFLFPIILIRRFLKHAGIGGGTDVKPFPRGLGWLDGLFRRVLASEAVWFKSGMRLPFGVSLLCYARKPDERH